MEADLSASGDIYVLFGRCGVPLPGWGVVLALLVIKQLGRPAVFGRFVIPIRIVRGIVLLKLIRQHR